MQRALRIASIAVLVAGLIWALQGAGYLGGSFMSGDPEWMYIGIATAIAGLVGLALVSRSRS